LKLTVTTFLTLDGVMQSPGGPAEDRENGFTHGGWLVPYVDEGLGAIVTEQFARAAAFLFGRTTYELLRAYWSQVTDPENVVAVKLNTLPKFVVSHSLKSADWANSTIVSGDVVEEVGKLKERPGGELQVHGSAGLVRTLNHSGLIDLYRLLIFPVLVGPGKRLFHDGATPLGFERLDVKLTDPGVTVLTLRPTGAPSVGAVTIEDRAQGTELVA